MKVKEASRMLSRVIVSGLVAVSANVVSAEELKDIEFEKNAVELFMGGTYTDDEGTNFSVGLAYERRFTEKLGLGGIVEYTEGEGREWVLAVPVIFHATESWKVFLAPGVEHEDGENEFMVRLGNLYDFDMGVWSLAPELSFDFVGDDVKTVFWLELWNRVLVISVPTALQEGPALVV